jgi:hypothetical protein
VVRQRRQREALAQLRTGSHWGAEETGRWARVPREQRCCPHCSGGAVEDAPHMLLVCPLYDPIRATYSDLFSDPSKTACMSSFLNQDPCRLASYAHACRQCWQEASPEPPPI